MCVLYTQIHIAAPAEMILALRTSSFLKCEVAQVDSEVAEVDFSRIQTARATCQFGKTRRFKFAPTYCLSPAGSLSKQPVSTAS